MTTKTLFDCYIFFYISFVFFFLLFSSTSFLNFVGICWENFTGFNFYFRLVWIMQKTFCYRIIIPKIKQKKIYHFVIIHALQFPLLVAENIGFLSFSLFFFLVPFACFILHCLVLFDQSMLHRAFKRDSTSQTSEGERERKSLNTISLSQIDWLQLFADGYDTRNSLKPS